ncbi:tetratricopeptide repeat protein [Parafilimonas sp.]|uniref:tetratricopeptide repeat protein n=1 Tax=Parafilimonas sp. TaxID=1969739 RepID=UPI0039E62E4E
MKKLLYLFFARFSLCEVSALRSTMRKVSRLFLTPYCIIFFSCNSNDTSSSAKKYDSIKNALQPLIESMEKQLKEYPDSAGLRLQYAFTLDSVKMYKEALAQMDSLTNKDSANYGLFFAKGEIAEDAGDTALAIKSYAKAARIYESPDVLLALANLYAEMKNDRAVLLCSRVKALGLGREANANCAFITGVYFARIHKGDEAVKYFDECIAGNYTCMEAYIEKGLIYFDAKQYDKALSVFQLASTVNNLYADAYYYMARCYEMMNKKDSAVLRFKQSLQLDPTLDEAGSHLKQLSAE